MSIVTITLGNRDFQLVCPEENKEALLKLGSTLDAELTRIKESNPSASFELLLVMMALKLQEEKNTLGNKNTSNNNPEDLDSILSHISSELKIVAEKLK